MVGNVQRHLQLLIVYAKQSLVNETTYRSNFVMATIGKILRIILLMVFFYSVSQRVPSIGEWNTETLYILVATFYIVDLVASIFFQRNLLYHLPRAIQDGTFDTFLLAPVSTLFQSSFRRIDPGDTVALIPFVGFWIWMVRSLTLDLTTFHVVAYLLFVLIGILLTYALTLGFGALAFWTVRGDGLGRMVDSITNASVYPLDIYPQPLRTVFLSAIPIALFAVIPTQALTGTLSVAHGILSLVVTTVFFCLALLLWNRGLRRYNSVSS